MTIQEKLAAIQQELKAPKTQYNSFGKYAYRSCEDILEAVKPLCAKYKAFVKISDEILHIGERYYIQATASLFDTESKGECESVTAYAREDEDKKGMDGMQITGAASSYARKYALNGLFMIDDSKDADAQNNGDAPKSTPAEKKADYTTADIAERAESKREKRKSRAETINEYAKKYGVESERVKDIVYKYVPDGILQNASDTAFNSILCELKDESNAT